MKLWIFRYQIEYRVFVYRPLLGYRIGEKKLNGLISMRMSSKILARTLLKTQNNF